eukprot:2727379-Alexandrium_andersonii.AAC.1
MQKGDVCRFIAAIAGHAQKYDVRAVRCRGGLRFTKGEPGEAADVLDMIGYDETVFEWYRAVHLRQ